jgi:hypothetical protein
MAFFPSVIGYSEQSVVLGITKASKLASYNIMNISALHDYKGKETATITQAMTSLPLAADLHVNFCVSIIRGSLVERIPSDRWVPKWFCLSSLTLRHHSWSDERPGSQPCRRGK